MKRLIYIAAIALLFTGCKGRPDTVHLYGKLSDMGGTEVIIRYNGASSMLGASRDVLIKTDEEGNFDITFPLAEPAYYSISRNTLYLTPGDDMKVYITPTNSDAVFEGRGAEANTYMKKRLFPKGGSFLEAGRNLKEDFPATAGYIRQLAGERRAELAALTSVSDEFKALEGARITADMVNSYFTYISYSRMTRDLSPGDANARTEEFLASIAPDVRPMIASISDDRYLDVAVVRDVFHYENRPAYKMCFADARPSERRSELYSTSELIGKIDRGINKGEYDGYKAKAESLKNDDFRAELDSAIEKAAVLMPGRPAFDLVMATPEGEELRLSDLKGKLLYIDFWATWCGPCIAESPHFDALAEKYSGRDDILLVKISTDTNHKAWLNYLDKHRSTAPQYNCTDSALELGWKINYIPRFVMIDKDFNIINAYAERPSNENIEDIINGLL